MASIIDIMEAEEEIRELMARYSLYLDNGRYDEWVDCFTEDGVYENPLYGRHPGKSALRKLVEGYKVALGAPQYRLCMMNIDINVDANVRSATGRSYWLYTEAKEGKTNTFKSGLFEDKIEKVNGKWLFKERQVRHDSLPSK
jgi:3-phenylpropionate/cinnamic acid dioxygenase small subunit